MNDNDKFLLYTRRAFLQKGLTVVSLAGTIPFFVERSAFGLVNPFEQKLTSSVAGVPDDRVLVVVQLGGGNDGLNTVIPYGDDAYYKARAGLGIRPNDLLRIPGADGIGFHPQLRSFLELHESGVLSTVQGVGYPNPNRSHFTSMDIWHTADPVNPNTTGWLGRYFDNTCNGSPLPESGIAIGKEAPHALQGEINKPVAFENPAFFRWIGQELHNSLEDPYLKINNPQIDDNMSGGNSSIVDDSQLAFLTRTSMNAQIASDKVRRAVALEPLVEYPNGQFARQMQMVAAMIRAGLKTKVYYVSLGGFDTHAGQAGTHANLLGQLGAALQAFYKDLVEQYNSDRVLTMVFSEFGRRVSQNASGGTDHGTAAPVWLMGPMVRSGLLGPHPSLTNLDEGDLKFNVDFRTIYAAILEQWFKADSRAVLQQQFNQLPVFNGTV